MSQHALQEATEAIQNELLAFSYTMLKKGYDVEGIMEFLSVCDDEDIDFILEDADILTEDVVDEMSDEDVNYYGEQLEIIAERFGGLGAAALRRMPPSMLRRLAASNEKIARLIRKLGLLDDGAKQTIKVKPSTRPSTIKPKPKTKPDSGSGSGTTKQPSGSGTTKTKTTRPGLGQTLKNNKGKILTTTAIGAGLGAGLFSDKVKDFVTGNNNSSTSGDTASADTSSTDSSTDSTDKGDEDKKPPTPPKPETGKTPWWLGPQGNQTKLGRRPRYDVALQSYRNPSQSLRNGFEMVADYLISEGHADTVEEARYVINQMEVDDITEILNEVIQ
tara:strand:+ start:155 stop:1150 length:996 start_codon:yes stop_codon:yes gene_type:complete